MIWEAESSICSLQLTPNSQRDVALGGRHLSVTNHAEFEQTTYKC